MEIISQKSDKHTSVGGVQQESVCSTYVEPESEELRKLLAAPDLGDFDVPLLTATGFKSKSKKKKGRKGKVKKKGRKKKREVKPPTKPIDPKSFFTYDPNVSLIAIVTK